MKSKENLTVLLCAALLAGAICAPTALAASAAAWKSSPTGGNQQQELQQPELTVTVGQHDEWILHVQSPGAYTNIHITHGDIVATHGGEQFVLYRQLNRTPGGEILAARIDRGDAHASTVCLGYYDIQEPVLVVTRGPHGQLLLQIQDAADFDGLCLVGGRITGLCNGERAVLYTNVHSTFNGEIVGTRRGADVVLG
ncbi:hypothetical protein FACS1894198_0210 [Clostridia bacterium]|nr:hypothetical protein FACS1894198_0210 [Clostridia bacterium]